MSSPPENLKHHVKGYYQQQRLSKTQLERLNDLNRNGKRSYVRLLGAIAASSILAITFYLYSFTSINYAEISKEIAYNHNSQMQMEVLSPTIDGIQGHLNRLGFSLVDSIKLTGDKWQLIGGRYCSIRGKIAAQIKVQHIATKKIYTFYQAKMAADLIDNLIDSELVLDGVKVKLWQEKGLLMGLAQ